MFHDAVLVLTEVAHSGQGRASTRSRLDSCEPTLARGQCWLAALKSRDVVEGLAVH